MMFVYLSKSAAVSNDTLPLQLADGVIAEANSIEPNGKMLLFESNTQLFAYIKISFVKGY